MAENAPPTRVSLHPLLWLAVSFAVGITAQKFFSLDLVTISAAGVLTLAASLALIRKSYAGIFVCVTFAALGFAVANLNEQSTAADRIKRVYDEGLAVSGDPVELEGVVQGGAEPALDGFVLKLKAERLFAKGKEQNTSGTVRLFVPTNSIEAARDFARLEIGHGSGIRVACRLEREDRFLNPGVIPRRDALDQQDIDAVASPKSPLLIEKLSDGSAYLRPVFEIREHLIEEFRRRFSPETAGVLIASLLGDRNFLDKPTADVFREGGTFHILVISGLHITFIGGLAVLAVGVFTRRRFWKFLVPLLFLWGYTIAVGGDVPVVRASLTFTVLLFSQLIYRRGNLLNSLGLCTLLLLVWRPQDLFSPSFQLTIVSVAAIVAFAFPLIEKLRAIGGWMPMTETPFPPNVPSWLRRFCEMLYWYESAWRIETGRQIWSAGLFKSPYLRWLGIRGWQAVPAYVFEGILVSLIVQIWLLPLLVWYFHRVSVASVVLNLWAGFLIALESFSAVFAVLSGYVSEWLAMPFIKITELFNFLLLWIPRLFIEQDFACIRLPVYSGGMGAIYFLGFIPVVAAAFFLYRWDPFAITVRKNRSHLSGPIIAAVAVSGIIIFHPWSAPAANGRLSLDFLDVGQGDSALITFPNGETMLVDGGGRMDYGDEDFEPDVPRIGEAVVSEFLWYKGYSHIDYILATHADSDHMQGLSEVAANFQPGKAFFGRTPVGDTDYDELNRVLTKRSIPQQLIVAGDRMEIGGVLVEVLYPEANPPISDNNHSVVLRLTFGQRSFLLTGDIEAATETELSMSPGKLKADVIKVPHHGSRTSSTDQFVKAVDPSFAVISVGRRSIFGHPHTEVVERWKNAGAKVTKTGDRGTVSVSTNGNDLETSSFQPSEE